MKKNILKNIIAIVAALVAGFLMFSLINYLFLPRMAWSLGLMISAIVGAVVTAVVLAFVNMASYRDEYSISSQASVGLVALLVVVTIIGAICNGLYNHVDEARNRMHYSTVNTDTFADMLPDVNTQGAYSWMDSTSARKLAARKTGELTELVSLYTVSDSVTTAIDDGKLVKYIPLAYSGFLKSRECDSIPGYIKVDPVTQTAEYVNVPIVYSPSAFFSKDLMRHVRSAFPQDGLGHYTFQVSPEGTPFWVVELEEMHSWHLGEVYAVAMVNATTGEISQYAIGETPSWVVAIHGDTATNYYNTYGTLANGYWNFSQKGETATTRDFGYVAINGELYYHTGITSVVNNGGDEANLGVLLFNAHSGEAVYCQVAGAEEYSAMAVAEGVVQNFGYEAAFPSLTNVDSALTYVMVLKDGNGIIKQYAMVNYDNFTIAVTADTLTACRVAYAKALATNGETSVESFVYKTITVDAIQFIVQGGETTVYIQDTEENMYKAPFEEGFLFIESNDVLEIAVIEDDSQIKNMTLSKLVPIEDVQEDATNE